MRIGIEAQRLFRAKKHGMDIYALELIKALMETDHENEYFIFVRRGPDQCISETKNFKIVVFDAISYADWEQIWLPIHVRKTKIDLLHCTANTCPWWLNKPTVVTLHDVIFMNDKLVGGTWYQRLGNLYRKGVVPHAMKRIDHAITVSKFEKKNIKECLTTDKDISVVYNGVGNGFKKTEKAPNRIKALPDKFAFAIGNKAQKKNVPGILKGYDQYISTHSNPLPLVLAEMEREDLKPLLKEYHLESIFEMIVCMGYVNQKVMSQLYQQAEVFIYPSFHESFGIPVIEAMASGTPVITSNTSALPEIAGEAAKFINPKNPIEIGSAMGEILSDSNLRLKMVESGMENIKRFSWSINAKRSIEIYQKVISKAA